MTDKSNFFDRLNNWARHSVMLKLFTIGFLILLLLVPSVMINSLISEREQTKNEAVSEVSSKWGESQQIGGPVISVPFKVFTKDNNGNTIQHIEYAHFLPDILDISGKLIPEKRYRGIYVVVLYNAKLKISGTFSQLNTSTLHIPKEDYIFKDAVLTLGISDMKGIKENISIKLNQKESTFEPGIPTHDIFSSGISLPIILDSTGLNFSFDIDINGSSKISFLPLGKETGLSLLSAWPNPSFEGSFLPDKHNIDENGFTANWRVLELNRNFPQQGVGNFISNNGSQTNEGIQQEGSPSFGVKLLLPVDEYQKTMRSSKYCFMFIILTFLAFFFVELFSKTRMHPVQYLIIGFAVVLFYILLLSFSEHVNFNLAYLVSCLAILVLITFYSWAVFRKGKISLLIFGLLSILYAFFYSLLQLQDYALLMGSTGLLLLLAIIMLLTKNIDWYAINNGENKE